MKKVIFDLVEGIQKEVDMSPEEVEAVLVEREAERLRMAEIREAARLKALEPTPEQRIAELEAKLAKLMAALGE